ncbi:MAG: hypothetical protein ABI852_15290 [Gemmatimonadaceae bacterium]
MLSGVFRHLVPVALFGATVAIDVPIDVSQEPPVPEWARAPWKTFAQTHSLRVSSHMKSNVISGKFDGDTTTDVAILVEHTVTKKIGIVFVHHGVTRTMQVGAGIELGNGGDNFDWMDSWKVEPRNKTRRTDALLVERESSASGLIYFLNGKYRWKQQGD